VSPNDPLQQFRMTPFARGFGAIILLIIGIMLLLPGLCALGFIVTSSPEDLTNAGMLVLWFICFAIAVGGGVLIWNAVRFWRAR
jgi:hypothetical protein